LAEATIYVYASNAAHIDDVPISSAIRVGLLETPKLLKYFAYDIERRGDISSKVSVYSQIVTAE